MIQSQGTDVFLPQNDSLRQQLKYSNKFWEKGANIKMDEILITGTLTQVKQNKQTVKEVFMLTSDGYFIKKASGQIKGSIHLPSKIVFLSFKENSQGEQFFEFEYFLRKKIFCFDAKWPDLLSRFCVIRNQVTKKFDFHTQISKGNFSKVYLVENVKNKQQYAAKTFLKEDMLKNYKLRDSILSEIIVLRKLIHENIIRLEEVHEDGSSVYMIYPIYRGGELFELFKSRKQNKLGFTEQEVSELMSNLMRGIAYMHSQEIMHRDLKLENLLLTNQNSFDVLIADFGLATTQNQKGVFKKCGTPGYIAPEILNLGIYNEKVDIFSAGVIAFILLTQKPVFKGNSLSVILTENTAGKIFFGHESFLKLSKEAQIFLKSTLSLQEDQRPSAQECLQMDFLKNLSQVKKGAQKSTNQIQPIVTNYLSSSIMPKSINLHKARRRSMRQYILLKQALNAHQQMLNPQELLKEMMKNGEVVEEEEEITEDDNQQQVQEDEKLVVTEAVQKINHSFYTESQKEKDQSDSGSGSSCDGDSSGDENLFVDDLEEKEALSNKMTTLYQIVAKTKSK